MSSHYFWYSPQSTPGCLLACSNSSVVSYHGGFQEGIMHLVQLHECLLPIGHCFKSLKSGQKCAHAPLIGCTQKPKRRLGNASLLAKMTSPCAMRCQHLRLAQWELDETVTKDTVIKLHSEIQLTRAAFSQADWICQEAQARKNMVLIIHGRMACPLFHFKLQTTIMFVAPKNSRNK